MDIKIENKLNKNEDKIIKMYEAGKPFTEIGRNIGVRHQHISEFLVNKGLYVRRKRQIGVTEKAVELARKGLEVDEIMQELGINETVASGAVRTAKIENEIDEEQYLIRVPETREPINLIENGKRYRDVTFEIAGG